METLATYGWGKEHPVAEGLFAEGHRFTFYQAVRLLERLMPHRQPVGENVDPTEEVVHFRSAIHLGFAPGEVTAVYPPESPDEAALMEVSFMGLAGVNSPLPPSFTESIADRTFRGDTALRDFLDIFNHRLVSLFLRARKKYRPPLSHRPPQQGRVARCLFAFLGLGTPGLEKRLEVDERAFLPYAGLFLGSRSMVGLEQFLADYFAVPVEAKPFQGAWHKLDGDQITRVGFAGQNQVLGESALLGRRVWDQQAAFIIALGPLTLAQMFNLLPLGDGYRELCSMARFYVGDETDFVLRLTLKREEIPPLYLGQAGDARLGWSARLSARNDDGDAPQQSELRLGRSGGARLGWTTWLGQNPPTHDGVVVVQGVVHPVGEEIHE